MTKKTLIAIAVIIVAALIAVSVYFAFNDTTYEVTVIKMERLSYSDNNAKYLIYCETDEVIAGLYRPPVCRKGGCQITRPPQSFMYVEEIEE